MEINRHKKKKEVFTCIYESDEMITLTGTLTLRVMQSTLRTAPCEDGPRQNDRHWEAMKDALPIA